MARLRWWSTFTILCGLAGWVGCRNDNPETPQVELPLYVRSTVPADSAVAVGLIDPIDISVTFRGAASAGEVVLRLVPEPLESGDVSWSSSGRTWTWHGIRMSAASFGYTLLVDGPRIPQPFTAHFFPSGWEHLTGRLGGCIDLPTARYDVRETLVFAIDAGAGGVLWEDLPATSRQPPTAVSRVSRSGQTCDSFYWLQYMHPDLEYLIFAILDTSDDGHYDIADDWWGVYGGQTATPIFPAVLFAPTWIDIELRRPHQG